MLVFLLFFHSLSRVTQYDRAVVLLERITSKSLVKIDIGRHLLLSSLKKKLTWKESTQKGTQ